MNPKPRLAVLTDFPDEGWPSMDLCGDMLLAHLPREGPLAFEVARLCPPFRRLATRLPTLGRQQAAFNADRLLNRFVHFPRHARRLADRFDLFHIADHTYAQLVHVLPADHPTFDRERQIQRVTAFVSDLLAQSGCGVDT